jgi:hypothetical protein
MKSKNHVLPLIIALSLIMVKCNDYAINKRNYPDPSEINTKMESAYIDQIFSNNYSFFEKFEPRYDICNKDTEYVFMVNN